MSVGRCYGGRVGLGPGRGQFTLAEVHAEGRNAAHCIYTDAEGVLRDRRAIARIQAKHARAERLHLEMASHIVARGDATKLLSCLRQRCRTLDEFATGKVAPAMGHQLGYEMLRVRWQKPLWIPRNMRPPADRRAAMNQRDRADAVTWHTGIRRKDCNRVVGRGEGDKRVRCGALQEYTRPDMRHVARDVEPLARSEAALRQQQRLVFKFGDLEQGSAGQPVRGRQRGDHMYRV